MLSSNNLPVIIVGAGPCGLVTAVTLQKYGVPFVIIEKASRSKICSNAGSGFELAPTAIEILENRLKIDIDKILSRYHGMGVLDKEGKLIRHSTISTKDGAVNRAQMQNYLLDHLFPSAEDEEGVLLCGSGLETFQEEVLENADGGRVVATLASGKTIAGSVLLACDGIHSRVRAVMHGGYDSTLDWETNVQRGKERDPLHDNNTLVYWGKTPVEKGSKLDRAFAKTQGKDQNCNSFVFSLTTPTVPANTYVFPSQNASVLNWAVTIAAKERKRSKNNDGSDLTRRGGGPLTEEEKKKLFDFTSHGKDSESVVRGMTNLTLVEELIKVTPAKDITEAGLFDRENLDLPYSSESKLVSLLGDAAHPQTPFLGQGVNMAITDAYVYATNIALAKKNNNSLREAITNSDTSDRHESANAVIKTARVACTMLTTTNFFMCWIVYLMIKYLPVRKIVETTEESDSSNNDFLKFLDENQCSPKEQEALRG